MKKSDRAGMAQRLGFNRRRFDKWAKRSKLPERNKMQPTPGSVETFRAILAVEAAVAKKWSNGPVKG